MFFITKPIFSFRLAKFTFYGITDTAILTFMLPVFFLPIG